jgi:exodeoxyribonuclease III
LAFSEDVQPDCVTYGIDDEEGDVEGRSITFEFPMFSLVNVYVPNAGAQLKRLSYRTETWDASLSKYIAKLKTKHPGRPVILTGDLNVAHTHLDFYNPHEPRMKTQAGTTPEEQNSFQQNLLRSLNMTDTFRHFFPQEKRYSYFSARKGQIGRDKREGWRLDYVLTDIPAEKLRAPQSSPHCTPYIEEQVWYEFASLVHHCMLHLIV